MLNRAHAVIRTHMNITQNMLCNSVLHQILWPNKEFQPSHTLFWEQLAPQMMHEDGFTHFESNT